MGMNKYKTCVTCKHFNLSHEGDWSYATPGAGFEMRCEKGKYNHGDTDLDFDEYRENMLTALKCKEYEHYE